MQLSRHNARILALLKAMLVVAFAYLPACWVKASSSPLGANPNFTTVDIAPDQSVGEIVAITQDHKGFLWVSGSSGIARYDGYRFHLYPATYSEIGQSFINDILEDSYHELWIASAHDGVAKLNRERDYFETLRYPESPDGELPSNRFERIYEDQQKQLWFTGLGGITLYDRQNHQLNRHLVGTELAKHVIVDMLQVAEQQYLFASNSGLFLWDRVSDELTQFLPSKDDTTALPHLAVRALAKDIHGNVWIGHGKGLSKFDLTNHTFLTIPLVSAVDQRDWVSIWNMFTDDQGLVWMGTDGSGLMYYNPQTEESGSYRKTILPTSLGTTVVRSIYKDQLGDFWIGGFPGGLFHYDQSNNFIALYSSFIRDQNDVFKNQVWAFVEDEKNNLWLGVDSLGLVYFDRKQNTFRQEQDGFHFPRHNFPYSVLSLLKDSHDNLWLGSWEQGVTKFNLKNQKFTHYNPNDNQNSPFKAKSVWSILETSDGDLYFGTMNSGLIHLDSKTNQFTQYPLLSQPGGSTSNRTVWSILEREDGTLWLATSEGISVFNRKTEKIKQYQHDPEDASTLSSNRVMSFLKDSKGRIWICTLDGGLNLFNPTTETFSNFSTEDGLSSDDVKTAVEDDDGTIWLSTTKGVSSLNPESKEIHSYTDKHWLQRGEFSHGSRLKLHNGNIAFGGAKGFNIVNPNKVTKNEFLPPIYATELIVLNTPIFAQEANPTIQKDIVEARKVTLSHKDTMFSVVFTALNYRVYQDNQYHYKLAGFDRDWHLSRGDSKAVYTRLAPGTYDFLVKAANNNGIWGPDTKLLEIEVLPAPWLTWWAYCIYFAISFYIAARYILNQKRKIREAKDLNDKLIELDKLKDDFLANTSHELRTPLNGVIGIAQSLQESEIGETSQEAHQRLEMIISCGRRLERLINNILDFSQSKKADFHLELSSESPAFLLDDVIKECETALPEDIELVNLIDTNAPWIICDPLRTQQIFYNILSNAIKFTESGSITVSLTESERTVAIRFEDTGIGIAEEQLAHLYRSFTQLADSGVHTKSGTGLSLTMTKYFVELQGGKLDVESELGKGSAFSIHLPKATEDHVANLPSAKKIVKQLPHTPNQEAALKASAYERSLSANSNRPHKPPVLANKANAANKHLKLPTSYPKQYDANTRYDQIVVVDDEAINRLVLREMLLKQNYIVMEAANGQELVDAIESGFRCDLILLDIMMPKLSGLDACKAIRSHYSAEELPIIFVSAKSQVSDLVECFHLDGNDYLSKPVNREELMVRVEAQLKFTHHYRDLQNRISSPQKASH